MCSAVCTLYDDVEWEDGKDAIRVFSDEEEQQDQEEEVQKSQESYPTRPCCALHNPMNGMAVRAVSLPIITMSIMNYFCFLQ